MAGAFDDLVPASNTQSQPPPMAAGGAFQDLIPAQQQQAAPAQQASMQASAPTESPFMAGVTAFNSGVENFTHGVMQPIYESMGDRVSAASKSIAKKREQDLAEASKVNPTLTPWLKLAGNLVGTSPLMALGGAGLGDAALAKFAPSIASKLGTFAANSPKLASFLGTTLEGATQGGLMGAGQYVNDGESRLANTVMGAGTGLLSYPIAKGLGVQNPFIKATTGGLLGGGISAAAGSDWPGILGGVAVGAVSPYALSKVVSAAANKIGIKMAGPENPATAYATKEALQGVDPVQAQETKAAADRLGLVITPAETGSQQAAQAQGAAGNSPGGAKIMADFGKQRMAQEKNIVGGFLNDLAPDNANASQGVRDIAQNIQNQREGELIGGQQSKINGFLNALSPNNQDAAEGIRQTAQKVINDQQTELSNKVKPIYEAAYKQEVDPVKLKALMADDGTIAQAVTQTRADPNYQYELKGYAPNSIKVLDLAKRRIDGWISDAQGTPMTPGNDDLVRVLTASKARLIAATDGFSDTYKLARSMYSEGAPALNDIRNSNVGKIASLDDTQLKNVGKIIFDPNQTDLNVLGELRDKISGKNPPLWNQLVRNEMERRLSAAPETSGALFYNKALGNQRDFAQFMEATKGSPELQSQLQSMRDEFSNSADQLKQLRGTDIARLANLNDTQLKNVSKMIFDPSQTDLSVLRSTKAHIEAQNPALWKQLMRNEIERRTGGTQDYAAQNFYDAVLKNENSFNQFMTASEGMPSVQQKLVDMRRTFKDLIDPTSVKTSAQLARNKMNTFRNAKDSTISFVTNLLGGQYDKKLTQIITGNQWDKELLKINRTPDLDQRALKLSELFARVPVASVTEQIGEQKQPDQ